MLALRALLHAYDLFPVADGIDGARRIVNDIEAPLAQDKRQRALGEVFIEPPGRTARLSCSPSETGR